MQQLKTRMDPRLLPLVLGVTTLVCIFTLLCLGGAPPVRLQGQERYHGRSMVVLESTGWHDEVVAALVYAIAQQPASTTSLTLYLKARRYGVDQLYSAFAPHASIFPASRVRDFLDLPGGAQPAPDLVVLATGERDFANHIDVIHHLFTSSPHTRLLCVVHHAAQWEAGRMPKKLMPFVMPWVEAARITFVTLAPHVADQLSTVAIPTWPGQSGSTGTPVKARVGTWVPVFEVAQAGLAAQRTSVWAGETAFAIQGNFDPARRNYDAVLARLGSAGHFDGVFDIIAAGFEPKPAEQTYRKFLSDHSVDPSRAAMFEDLARNLTVPPALGMTTVLVVPDGTKEVVREDWELEGRDAAYVDHVTDDLTGFLAGLSHHK
jgi:hypothetical protein